MSFADCYVLKDVIFGSSVTTIGFGAFIGCTALPSITIPGSVTTIDRSAFSRCSSLVSATLGSGVTSIGGSIFGECNKLTDVVCLAATPPEVAESDFGVYEEQHDAYTHATLHVWPESLGAYQAAFYWKDFAQLLGDVAVGAPGDVNGDGVVTICDANSVIEVIINGGSKGGHNRAPIEGTFNYGDMNGDNLVNITDLNLIIDLIIGN